MGRLLPGNDWPTNLSASVNFKIKNEGEELVEDTGCLHLASTYIHTHAYFPTSSHVYTKTYMHIHPHKFLSCHYTLVFSIRSVVYSFIGHFGPIKTFCLIRENLRFKIIFHETSTEMSTWSTEAKNQTNNKLWECAFFLRWQQPVFMPDAYLQTFRTFSLPQVLQKLTKMQLGWVGFLLLDWKTSWAFNLSSATDIISHYFSDNFFDKCRPFPFLPLLELLVNNYLTSWVGFPIPPLHISFPPCCVTGEECPIPDFDTQYFLFYYLAAALIIFLCKGHFIFTSKHLLALWLFILFLKTEQSNIFLVFGVEFYESSVCRLDSQPTQTRMAHFSCGC